MRKPLVMLLSVFWVFPVFADSDPLVGVFGHEFTNAKNDPVYTVKKSGESFDLFAHGDESIQILKMISAEARQEFWNKMWWELSSSEKAQCLGNEKLVMCFVPEADRGKEPYLAAHKTDYFYYDQIAGVMEIAKISD